MKDYYEMTVAGLTRKLPICKLTDDLCIAGFIIFGDPELTTACAKELLKIAPPYDYILAPEAKAIPLAHEMARLAGNQRYIIARKKVKAYMRNVHSVTVRSITTAGEQTLCIDGAEADLIRGKRVLILDDVISTGASLTAVEKLVTEAGGQIAGRMAILAEGDAVGRKDILYLAPLPLFDKNGDPLN